MTFFVPEGHSYELASYRNTLNCHISIKRGCSCPAIIYYINCSTNTVKPQRCASLFKASMHKDRGRRQHKLIVRWSRQWKGQPPYKKHIPVSQNATGPVTSVKDNPSTSIWYGVCPTNLVYRVYSTPVMLWRLYTRFLFLCIILVLGYRCNLSHFQSRPLQKRFICRKYAVDM